MKEPISSKKQPGFAPTHYLFSLGRWFYLLHAIVFLLFLYPYLETAAARQSPLILTCAHSAIVFAMIYAVSSNFHQFVTGCSLGIPVLISYWIPINPGVELMSLSSTIFLYGYTLLILLTHLTTEERVSSQQLYGAAAFYLLLGLTWAHLHQLIELIYPGSYFLAATHNADGVLNWSDFLYFSFVTITTLGYGDMAPISSPARSLSMMEAVTGVLFMGIMIGRVVSLSLGNQDTDSIAPEQKSDEKQDSQPSHRDITDNREVLEAVPTQFLPVGDGEISREKNVENVPE